MQRVNTVCRKEEYMKNRLNNNLVMINAITLTLFNFVFLGTEYMYDNMMSYVTDSQGVVAAQNYILGISVLGFLMFPVLKHYIANDIYKRLLDFIGGIAGIISLVFILLHNSYISIFAGGCAFFFIMGIIGSRVHYRLACSLSDSRNTAKVIGCSYAAGILLQFINNNVVLDERVEMVILAVGLVVILVIQTLYDDKLNAKLIYSGKMSYKNTKLTAAVLVGVVALMTCIFSTLDNAVTLVHAGGSVDIGQWPRLLLAVSGLAAGFAFDVNGRRYINMIMYSVTLLSVICVVVIVFGGSFLVGLIAFYLSAGFFVVYFTTMFIDLSYNMKVPELWAGLGRAVNNICAVITSYLSIWLLSAQNGMIISLCALILFMLISIGMFIYSGQTEYNVDVKLKQDLICDSDADKMDAFAKEYSLTEREKEILVVLLSSDESISDIANNMYISRTALYRHITSLNEKTDTKSRIGLIQLYYSWNKNNNLGHM